MTEKKKPEEVEEVRYAKEQILASSRYSGCLDLVGVLLRDGETYTLGKADSLIDEFKKREVK